MPAGISATSSSCPTGYCWSSCLPISPSCNLPRRDSQGTSEDEVLLTPRLGHAALLALARWMAERHVQVETTTSLLAGSAARPTAAVDGADRQADLPASRGVAPGGGP